MADKTYQLSYCYTYKGGIYGGHEFPFQDQKQALGRAKNIIDGIGVDFPWEEAEDLTVDVIQLEKSVRRDNYGERTTVYENPKTVQTVRADGDQGT